MPHGHMGGEWFWGMWIGMALFWVSLLAFGVWAVNRLSRGRSHGGTARRILEERFARGEIDEKEFRSKSETLGGPR